MASNRLPVGSYVWIAKPDLQAILNRLRATGFRVVGPQVRDGAVVYDDLAEVQQLPIGQVDRQDGGYYRLESGDPSSYFDWAVGPHSPKRYLFPPQETVLESRQVDGRWQLQGGPTEADRLALIGLRGCDLAALKIQDRVFLGDRYVDPAYEARRSGLFVLAVNCRRAAATCFCHSMKTGPGVREGFDLALTELSDRFVIEVGSDCGGSTVTACSWSPCTIDEIQHARQLPDVLRKEMLRLQHESDSGEVGRRGQRYLDAAELHDLLLSNLEHPRWEQVAERCLACGNCTLVCPTCFCSNVDDATELSGTAVQRQRTWASCFTAEHSYMNSGTVRKSIASRYRQWLTHKLASWIDQFGSSGCVGCGRCITWCPVGIDLTEEVAAIRGDAS